MSEESYAELLDKVRQEIEDGLEKKKKRILELAEKLEKDGVVLDRISTQVSHDLDDLLSSRYVRKVLPDKYKAKEQQRAEQVPREIQEIQENVENIQSDGTILVGGGPSLDNPEVKQIIEDYKKTRDENRELQSMLQELQIKWNSICPEHQRAITDCKKCGE